MRPNHKLISLLLVLLLLAALVLPAGAAQPQDCGAKLRIGAATDEDLDRLCCRMTLQIPGRKG